MREIDNPQYSFSDTYPEHKIGRELSAIAALLEADRQIVLLVHRDLTAESTSPSGRKGLTAEQVLRCAVLKQWQQLPYEDLEFHLRDSDSFRKFARISGRGPSGSALQSAIKAITSETWEKINQALLGQAQDLGIETGHMTRLDSTAVETFIHHPTDAALLQDCIRVLTRLMALGLEFTPKPRYRFVNHNRVAKRLVLAIKHAGEAKQVPAYKKLLSISHSVYMNGICAFESLKFWLEQNAEPSHERAQAEKVRREIGRVLGLMQKIIEQTDRRVLKKESVPAGEKVVSIFESHSDIITKSRRETVFGHKIFLTTGKSSMIVDCMLPRGNPADAEQFEEMLDRQIKILGKTPKQLATDGGFASRANLALGKNRGVKDVAFAKRRGIDQEEMTRSRWVYRKLRNFRAGIEGNISTLKRAFGLDRCTWKSWEGFKRYVWSAIVSYNLRHLARHQAALLAA